MATRRRKKDEPPVLLTDPRAIRALAHPARLAVIDALGGGRTLTATQAAKLVDLTPSAMSYHLRALAKWGIVREAAPSGKNDSQSDGRERRWEMAGSGLSIESMEPGAGHATAIIAAQSIDRDRAAVVRWLEAGDGSEAWHRITAISHSETWLTEPEAEALSKDVQAAFDRYRYRHRERPDGARRVRLGFVLVPIDPPE